MKANRVKQALKAGDSVLGTMIHEVRNPELAYLLAAAGMDFLLVDTEHASPDTETIQNLTRAAKSAGMVPLARVTDNEYFLIARTLDMGVMGVMVPRVDTRQEAERAVAAVKYPPEGRRGFGMRPVITDYESTSVPEAMAWSNENTLVILQVESEAAVANLEQITRVPGVDVSAGRAERPVDFFGGAGGFSSIREWRRLCGGCSKCARKTGSRRRFMYRTSIRQAIPRKGDAVHYAGFGKPPSHEGRLARGS